MRPDSWDLALANTPGQFKPQFIAATWDLALHSVSNPLTCALPLGRLCRSPSLACARPASVYTHTQQWPLPPRALTASAGSLSLLRAGGAGSSRTSSAGGRARLRLLLMVGAEARDEGLAGLGVLQVALARDDEARGPGRRRAKKSVRRRCAITRCRTRAELLEEMLLRFAPIFAPRVATPPPRTKSSSRRRGVGEIGNGRARAHAG